MTTTSLLPDVGIELREDTADVGDVLHHVEAGDSDGLAIVGPDGARLPEIWVGLEAAGHRAAGAGGSSGRRARHARLQPVIEARGLRVLRCRPAGRRHPRFHRRARCRVRAVGRSRLGRSIAWTVAMNHPEVVERLAILNVLIGGGFWRDCTTLSQLAKSAQLWYRDSLRKWCTSEMALLPALPGGCAPGLHRPGNRTLRGGMVTAGSGGRDDQLLPGLGETIPEEAVAKPPPDSRRRPGRSGGSRIRTSAPISPSPIATMCPTSTVWRGCRTRRTGCITTRLSGSTSYLPTSSPRRP